MTRGARIGALAIAVLIAVAAFVVLGPGGEQAEQGARGGEGRSEEASQRDGGASGERRRPAVEAAPSVTSIRLRAGRPVGGVKEISVESGEPVRLEVRSDQPAELHIHGYDRYVNVEPGKVARTRFRADLEGVFEIEDHGSAAQVAELRVSP